MLLENTPQFVFQRVCLFALTCLPLFLDFYTSFLFVLCSVFCAFFCSHTVWFFSSFYLLIWHVFSGCAAIRSPSPGSILTKLLCCCWPVGLLLVLEFGFPRFTDRLSLSALQWTSACFQLWVRICLFVVFAPHLTILTLILVSRSGFDFPGLCLIILLSAVLYYNPSVNCS